MDKDFFYLHSELCKTLANPKRLEILDNLREGKMSVNELVKTTGIAQANLSQHLAIMRARGVLISHRDGANVYYVISNPKIYQAFDLLTEVMQERLVKNDRTIDEGVSRSRP